MATKLKYLKNRIKQWVAGEKIKQAEEYLRKTSEVERLELIAESRPLSQLEDQVRDEYRAFMLDFDKMKQSDLRQKARVKWVVEGDENSGFFHGVINSNTANRRINGIMVTGEWVDSPIVIIEQCLSK